MGDMPHGWACAEFMLLMRDILFFEADEDGNPHIYIAPGVMPHWLKDNQSVTVNNAPTIFGQVFGYRLIHSALNKEVVIDILQPPPANVSFVYSCKFGNSVVKATADGAAVNVSGKDVRLPGGTMQATVKYV
jgi:hypothetical protein